MDRPIQCPRAYRQVCLPAGASKETIQIHLVFQVSLLCPAAQDPIPGQSNQHPGPIIGTDIDDPNLHKVETIIDSKELISQHKFKYLVK